MGGIRSQPRDESGSHLLFPVRCCSRHSDNTRLQVLNLFGDKYVCEKQAVTKSVIALTCNLPFMLSTLTSGSGANADRPASRLPLRREHPTPCAYPLA